MRVAVLALAAGCSFHHGIDPLTGDAPALPGDTAHDPDASAIDAAPRTPRKKPITIDHQQVSGSHTYFPVWIDLVDPQVKAGARADGADLYFTDVTGAALPYELARWDAGVGHLSAWVRIPTLTQAADVIVYLRYGGSTAAPPPSPAAVFAVYSAVWHFDDALATTTVTDALGQTDGTAVGLGPSRVVDGRLAGAFDFDGQQMAVTFTNMLQNNMPHTISAWVDQRTRQAFESLVVVGTNAAEKSRWLYTAFNNPSLAVGLFSDDVALSNADIENDGWTLVHWVFDGVDRSTLYVNGASLGTFQHQVGVAQTTGSGGWIGWAPTGWGANNGLNGRIDEVRIASAMASSSWIATEWANQRPGATFFTVGPDQPAP